MVKSATGVFHFEMILSRASTSSFHSFEEESNHILFVAYIT